MKLQCTHCGEVYEGVLTLKGEKWLGTCSKCGAASEYEVPDKKIVMIFSDDTGDDYEEFFTNEVKEGTRILSVYTYDTEEEFIENWLRIKEDPDSMWYWVFKDGEQICSGACDPDDLYTFLDELFVDLCMAPDNEENYCKQFWVNPEWLRKSLRELCEETEKKTGEAVAKHYADMDWFLDNYTWSDSYFVYEKAKKEGVILYESEE